MISVIIPAYKNKGLLSEALNSIIKQQYSDYEIIVVDDTPDNSIEDYCKEFNCPVLRYYHNVPSKGAIDNWNYGLSLAKGDKLILLHHDESFINEDFFRRLVILLDKYEVVIHNKRVLLASGEKNDRIPEWVKKVAIQIKYPLFSLNFIGPCACVALRREVLQEFDNRLHWKVDTEWYFRILKSSKRTYYSSTREILSHHGHDGQITKNIDIKKTNDADIRLIKVKYKNIMISLFLTLGQLLKKAK